MALIKSRIEKKITMDKFKRIVITLEKFHFLFTAITSSRASGLEGKYSKYARQILYGKSQTEVQISIEYLINELKEKVPSRAEFVEKFSKLKYTKEYTKDKKLIQYIFNKMELYQRTTDELKTNIISIEHIMSESTKNEKIGFIGNLIPLDKDINSEMGDVNFDKKVDFLSKSELSTVSKFVNDYKNQNWNENNIEERTKVLGEFAYDFVWKIL